VENDNENITLLKPEFFCDQGMQQGHLLIEGSEEGYLREGTEGKRNG